MEVSILIPAYNEEGTLESLLRRANKADLSKELIVVDDGSEDNTPDLLKNLQNEFNIKIAIHDTNKGKGAAIRTGLALASGDVILVQDADLEYHPEDYSELLQPIQESRTKVVYGSRLLDSDTRGMFVFYWGGMFLTFVGNLLFDLDLTDITTGYKVLKREVLEDIVLERDGFEFCEEITAKLAKNGYRIKEVPIQYSPRKYFEGKKLRPWDGVIGLWILVFYKFFWEK